MSSWSLPLPGGGEPPGRPPLPLLLMPLLLRSSDAGTRVSDRATTTARWRHSAIAQGRGTHTEEEEEEEERGEETEEGSGSS